MKKILFLLLFLLWGIGSLYATVTVTPLGADYATQTVTFKVSWTGTAANNRVWVWVDFCPVSGASSGTFAKAVIGGAAAITGNIATVSGNMRGFYVTTNPSTVTATLNNATGNFNWCAYGSDYPPNAIDNSSGGYALRGSPPFIITTSSGTTEVNANTFSGGTITALTDATGCPGALCGKNGEAAGLLNCCAYGTTNCSGACTTTGTYTTNDGICSGSCAMAYVQLRDECGTVINSTYSTYAKYGCWDGCTSNCESAIKMCETTSYPYASTWGSFYAVCTPSRCGSTWMTTACVGFSLQSGTWNLYVESNSCQSLCSHHTKCN